MPPPDSGLRDGIAGLNVFAANDLNALWLHVETPGDAKTALYDVLPSIVSTYGTASATLAADWYDEQREKNAVKGNFRAIPADIPDPGTEALIGWASATATDMPAFQTLILGGVQRRIANFGRDTVSGSSIEDPGAQGWQREGSGDCDFCAMLIGRGAVYREETADFASHDHCRCSAVPAFDGVPIPVKPYKSPLTEVSAGDREPPSAPPEDSKSDEPLTPMERMARALTPAELRMETRRGSAKAREMAKAELRRRGLR